MSSIGFPDWQSSVRWFGDPIIDEVFTYAGVDVVRGPFAIPTYKSLLLFAGPGLGDLRVQVNEATESADPAMVRLQSLYFPLGLITPVVMPLFADRVLSMTFTGSLNPQDVHFVALPTNLDPWVKLGIARGTRLYLRDVPLAVGANRDDLILPFVGSARLTFNASAYPCSVSVRSVDHLGAEFGLMWEHPAVAGPVNDAVALTSAINRVRVTNNAGAPITYSLGITGILDP